MRRLIVIEFVSLDGVVQAPGGPDEDPSGGFARGGWIRPYADPAQSGDDGICRPGLFRYRRITQRP